MKIIKKGKFIAFIIIIFLLIVSGISFSVYRNKYVIFKDNFIEFSARVNLHESGGILRTDAERLQLESDYFGRFKKFS